MRALESSLTQVTYGICSVRSAGAHKRFPLMFIVSVRFSLKVYHELFILHRKAHIAHLRMRRRDPEMYSTQGVVRFHTATVSCHVDGMGKMGKENMECTTASLSKQSLCFLSFQLLVGDLVFADSHPSRRDIRIQISAILPVHSPHSFAASCARFSLVA